MDMEHVSLSQLRKTVIEKLKYHYAHGNLEDEEFERMLGEATNAETKDALVPIHKMLSPVPEEDTDSKKTSAASSSVTRKSYGTFMSILGGTERRGIWNVPKRNRCINILGGTELNLTQCELNNEDTVFEVVCILGGMEIIVPDNVNVVVESIPILGGIEDSTQSHSVNGPTIIIRGIVALGGIEIRQLTKRERRKLKRY
ncbi:MAG: DUF1707 domain-containing protein [Spirochaetales bacterium]|nr:DUF1707 domain-containing protein [Spirochaetales bacterium]